MTTIGDLIFWACVLVALWYVPRYLWKVYGGPDVKGWMRNIMSGWGGTAGPIDGSSTGASVPVLPQQHQATPELVLDFVGVLTFLAKHNLTDEQAIDLLTLAHRESGDLLSANKIRDIVGGNEAAVKARVASHRPKPVPVRTQGHMERPANGW